MQSAEEMIRTAREQRKLGNADAAEASYEVAAALALIEGSAERRAHALRHVAELAAARGQGNVALEAADEAVAIYASAEPDSLNLANAHRVRALAFATCGRSEDSQSDWREARKLYEQQGIEAGVAECDRRLKPD